MNHLLIGQLGLVAVPLAVIRSADHIHALSSGRAAGAPNLRSPALLAAAVSVSSTLYAQCIDSDLHLLSAALINACTAIMDVVMPTMVVGPSQPETAIATSSEEAV